MTIRRFVVLSLTLLLTTSGCRWIVRASVDSGGIQANGHSGEVALSGDGRFVAFDSDASNLVVGDTNGDRDVFVRDNRTGWVERAYEGASLVDMTEDGRYVAVRDHGPCKTLPADFQLFVRDRQTGDTECIPEVSFDKAALTPHSVAMSATGRFFAVSTPVSRMLHVFDRETGETELFPSPTGTQAAHGVGMSDDGRQVVFRTLRPCSSPPPDPCWSRPDTFVLDRETGITTGLPLPPQGATGSSDAVISGDGRWVAYRIHTFRLLQGGDKDSTWRYELATGVAEPVSVAPDGTLAHTYVNTRISDDGRYVQFESSVALDPELPSALGSMLYVRDMVDDRTTLVNRNAQGVPATGQLDSHTLADDGRYVAFTSTDDRLVPNDTNAAADVFLRANPTPIVSGATPSSTVRGSSTVVSLSGAGFALNPTVWVSGAGVTVTGVTRVSEHELLVAVTVETGAPTGSRTIFVTNSGTGPGPTVGDTGSCGGCLTIT